MATTRFYFASTGTPAVSPARDAGWELPAGTTYLKLIPMIPSGTAFASGAPTVTPASGDDVLRASWVTSVGLQAQTISGSASMVMRVKEALAANDLRSQLVVKVVSSDGSTVRGTLIAMDTGSLTNEWDPTTATNRYFPKGSSSTSLTSVTAQAGDLLVVEVGYRVHASGTTNPGNFRIGDPTATADLALNETGTSDLLPWIEFNSAIGPYSSAATAAGTASQTGDIVGVGVIAGTASATAGQTGSITGTGVITASSSATAAQTGTVTGTGVIDATASATASQSGSVTGLGDVSASSSATAGQSASVTGLGVVDGTASVTAGQTGQVTGVGDIAGQASAIASASAGVVGTGDISGQASAVASSSATVTGLGDVSGTSSATASQAASVVGVGVLQGTSSATAGQSGTATDEGTPADVQYISGILTALAGQSGTLVGFGFITAISSATAGQTAIVTAQSRVQPHVIEFLIYAVASVQPAPTVATVESTTAQPAPSLVSLEVV